MRLELSLHQPLCGRNRKNIKLIESATATAIYLPPSFSSVFHYCPPNARPRDPTEIFITGEDPDSINQAKKKIHEVLQRVRLFVKDVLIPPEKIDSILLSRMDKVRKIVETNGTYILFPSLGSKQSTVRIQATENLHAERTARELMALVSLGLPARFVATRVADSRPCRLANSTVGTGPSRSQTTASSRTPAT